jgi:hypothetical protein
MNELPHDDVEFQATKAVSEESSYFKEWKDAEAFLGEAPGTIDVLIWSASGAEAYGGSDALEQYSMDPEASVFERWIRDGTGTLGLFVNHGMIP